ncbi:MAG: hypothetical protein EA391_03710 [Balneolaceae bacterium]|nr:MAG: hypothetical protein EA391_03710 [Balneolaceae bacterium]
MHKPLKNYLLIVLFTAAFIWSCSDANSANELDDEDIGEVTFTISGDLEGTSSGAAFFDNNTSGNGGDYYFELIFMDGIDGPETFRFTIGRYRGESFSAPTPGTYEIDGRPFNFTAAYEYTTGSFTGTEQYTDQYCEDAFETGGELVISSVSDSQVSGSFNFTVAGFDDLTDCNLLGYVEISGNFRAVPYDKLFL